MKTAQQIDALMSEIPKAWQTHWCQSGLCACLGCVQTGNKATIYKAVTGRPYGGDPERISAQKLIEAAPDLCAANTLTRADWEDWSVRQQRPPLRD